MLKCTRFSARKRAASRKQYQIAILVLLAPLAFLPASANAADDPAWTLKQAAPLEVGLVTRNIDKMLPFYRDVLGFKFISDVNTPPELSTKTGATRSGYRIIRLQTPLGERIKLVQPGRNGGEPGATLHAMGRSGFEYLTFIVSDMKGTLERLKAAKTPLLSNGEAVEVRPGVHAIYSRDPEGNFVEFVQFDDLKSYRPEYAQGAAR
jgi:catechol 2,3-dioxygenase-like lactoylglutathione lyase family enzyme